jgi:hypothetical protein
MEGWLSTIGLSAYVEAIKDYGYTQISMLLDASEADIKEMAEDSDVGMKKPARKTMLVQWGKLKLG